MKTVTTLVLDDDIRMAQLVRDILKQERMTAMISNDGREALQMLNHDRIDLVITDLRMPHVGGMEVLEYAKTINPGIVVIMITGYGSIESAIAAVKKGAYDYIEKPFEPDAFLALIRRAREFIRLSRENVRLLREIDGCKDGGIVGTSRTIENLKELIAKISPFDTTVLIQGETGTGKELAARLIHNGSKRSREVFLPVNCAALAESLLESELFGYEKGAFTGADRMRKGLFESADGGTIFLDEIHSTSTHFQVKLLRVLQEGSFLRVGGTEPVSVDVRIIAASNTPLEKEEETGKFRKDLLYRLNMVTIDIPPLRKRKEDIPSLAYHFLNKFSLKYGKQFNGIAAETISRLSEYSWPGNVRELENVIEKAIIFEPGDELRTVHLPRQSGKQEDDHEMYSGLVKLEDAEKIVIRKTLDSLQGQKAKAAAVLGISTTSLWRKIRKYGLE
jgi:DNA-binding NtrC family response regulator